MLPLTTAKAGNWNGSYEPNDDFSDPESIWCWIKPTDLLSRSLILFFYGPWVLIFLYAVYVSYKVWKLQSLYDLKRAFTASTEESRDYVTIRRLKV
jgi:hypothetical protein